MNRKTVRFALSGLGISFNLVAIGLGNLNHPIERSTFDKQLHRLIVKLMRTQIATKNRFEAKHGGFSERLIARIAFPAFVTMFTNRMQILISGMRLAFAVAVLPNHRIFVQWNDRFGSFGGNLVLAMTMVVRSIGQDLFYWICNGIQHVF